MKYFNILFTISEVLYRVYNIPVLFHFPLAYQCEMGISMFILQNWNFLLMPLLFHYGSNYQIYISHIVLVLNTKSVFSEFSEILFLTFIIHLSFTFLDLLIFCHSCRRKYYYYSHFTKGKKKTGHGEVRKIAKQGDGTADVNPQGAVVQCLSL